MARNEIPALESLLLRIQPFTVIKDPMVGSLFKAAFTLTTVAIASVMNILPS